MPGHWELYYDDLIVKFTSRAMEAFKLIQEKEPNLEFFFRKILNLAVRRILIRRRELTLFIGKPGPKTAQ